MADDALHEDIHRLILASDDPKDKAVLLILLRISQNLEANTELTAKLSANLDAHVSKFNDHEKMEMALFNQGRGLWRVMVWVLGIAQAGLGYGFLNHVAKNEQQDERLVAVEKWSGEHRVHHQMEERGLAK